MKRTSSHGFTLIEMITVVAIIVILAGLVISVAGFANKKAAAERASGEMKAFGTALDAYKIDNGSFVQTEDTDELDPRQHFSAIGNDTYQKANIDLYKALAGDNEPDGEPDGKPEAGTKVYYSFNRSQLATKKNAQGEIEKVQGIQDPFGAYYGYSTAGAKDEAEYRKKIQVDASAERPKVKRGFNTTYDLWSTAGATTESGQPKWIKNWGG
jgi:prepilin-type N-terminal cleavage/methylation domain-containing protein